MSGRSIASWLGVNRNLSATGAAPREFRLPKSSPFPKLDRASLPAGPGVVARATRATDLTGLAGGTVNLPGGAGTLPEMMGDLIDPASSYTLGNTKRAQPGERTGAGRAAFGQFLGRMLGDQRGVRP